MTLGPVRVMGAGVVVMSCALEVLIYLAIYIAICVAFRMLISTRIIKNL